MRSIAAKTSLTVALVLTASVGHAADIPASIARCAAINDDTVRLACFDAATGRHGANPVVVKPAAIATRAEATLPTPDVAAQSAAVVADSFESSIKSAQRRPTGEWTVLLEDGTSWSQADTSQEWTPKIGEKVQLKKAMLGSWFLRRVGRNTVIRVRPAQ
jgi:hypothetical protein